MAKSILETKYTPTSRQKKFKISEEIVEKKKRQRRRDEGRERDKKKKNKKKINFPKTKTIFAGK